MSLENVDGTAAAYAVPATLFSEIFA